MRIRALILPVCVIIAGCGGRTFVVDTFDDTTLVGRSIVQTEGDVTVRTTIASPDEAKQIFGIPLYDDGVQPVWVRVENNSDRRLRYAPVSTDREYFAPLEVAFVNRSGFSKESRKAMNWHFHELAIPRYVKAGESIEGFVFTHAQPGTKGYNVDLFGEGVEYRFTFFVTLPGFVPDHAEIEFRDMYSREEVVAFKPQQFLTHFSGLQCCSTDESGNGSGSPLNVALIGKGMDVLYALLRSQWREAAKGEEFQSTASKDYWYLGRRQDAMFIYEGRGESDGYYEMRLWLAPYLVDEQPVWIGQLRHFIEHRWTQSRPDPDVYSAQSFFLQNIWYSASLLKFSILPTDHMVAMDEQRTDFQGGNYFSDGKRTVLWLSDSAVPLNEVQEFEFSGAADVLE